ncbi:hypothetical protein [Pseudoclavibacter sp. VKM Ac-2867]|uniref:hypothetical protein n=1 Tax=Pseudoclavibacter sp. VKM Ac-2867 TaxID=2783829 RepID=UPI00188D1F14|nr:hypothetical protein [Pseudoclavibacter sp. VKM Ac-2867]MBF4460189.1 hypothetical protein [Pseudoclavibacter sp. VKM Ac-2867]
MDEIELLRRVRADQPEPSQAAVGAGREAILRRSAQAQAELSKSASKKRHARRGSRFMWGVGAVAVTGAAAAAMIFAAALQPGPPVPVVGSSASPASTSLLNLTGPDLLRAAAANVRAAGDEQVLPGQYLRVESRDTESHHVVGDPQGPSWTVDYSRALYIPADKNDEWVATESEESIEAHTEAGAAEVQDLREALEDQAGQSDSTPQYERAARGEFVSRVRVAYEMLTFDWAGEPDGVLDQLYEIDKYNVEPESQAFARISELIDPGYLAAEDRALLLEAAAIIPGVSTAVTPVEIHGKSGIAVTLRYGAVDRQLIFDPRTGLPIGRQVISDAHSSFGWGSTSKTYTSEVVSTAPRD